jgi:hypothetical protein
VTKYQQLRSGFNVKLWDLPLPSLLDEWDRWDKAGTDLAGIRALCLEDRFYLLVKGCGAGCAAPVDIRALPGGGARPGQPPRPVGSRALQVDDHHLRGVIQEILRDPEITVCIFSHTKGIARKFFRQIKLELESNEVLKRAPSPTSCGGSRTSRRRGGPRRPGLVVKRKSNPKESTLEAWGLVDGQPTAAHYRLRVYDDVVAPESVTTPDQVRRPPSSWELSDNLGTVDGRKWHVGTRYSFADTYQAILSAGAEGADPPGDGGRNAGR